MSEEEYLQSCAKRAQTDRIDRTVDHLLKWAQGTQTTIKTLFVFAVVQIIIDIALLITLLAIMT